MYLTKSVGGTYRKQTIKWARNQFTAGNSSHLASCWCRFTWLYLCGGKHKRRGPLDTTSSTDIASTMSLSDQLIKSRRLRLPPAAVINAIRNSSRRQKRIPKRINSGRSDIIGISRHINITDCQTYQKLLGPVYTSVPLSDNLLFFIDSLTNDLTDSEGESARHQRQATMTNRQFSELLNSLNICFQFITPESIARCIFSI